MSWVITGSQPFPAVIGEPFGGGYFAGYISHTADGNPTHALIVAPRETGATGTGYTLTTNLAWKTSNTATANTASLFDGAANTAAMIADDVSTGVQNHPAAQFCVNLSIGGFTDWYLPSLLELDIAYFNLKPTTAVNLTTTGANNYAVPLRSANYSSSYPAQTFDASFNTSAQAFIDDVHWSSYQTASASGWRLNFNSGATLPVSKSISTRVRAFRRIAL